MNGVGFSALRLRPVLWVVVLLGVAGVVAWQARAWNAPPPSGDEAAGGAIEFPGATGLTLYPTDGRPSAPVWEGITLDGEPIASADLAGHVVVLNVWGSWCGPCRAEAPDLARLARETASRGVRFVGIDTRDTTAAAQAFVRAFDVPYPSVADPDGQVLLEFQGIIPVTAVPSTLVLDRDGGVAARVVGPVSYSTLRGLLDDELALAGKSASATSPRGAP